MKIRDAYLESCKRPRESIPEVQQETSGFVQKYFEETTERIKQSALEPVKAIRTEGDSIEKETN